MKQRIFSHFQDYLIQYISHQYHDLLYCNYLVLNIFCLHITVSIIIIIIMLCCTLCLQP